MDYLDPDGTRYVKGDRQGQQMAALNAAALNERYPHNPDARALGWSPECFRWSPAEYSKWELLKAADCWLYQCHEGEVWKCDLYSQVQQQRDALAFRIIRELPEYDAVGWDLPHNRHCMRKAAQHA